MIRTALRSAEAPRYFHLQEQAADLPTALPYKLQRTYPSVRGSSTSPSLLRIFSGCWNINQLSIGFAFRLILRPRLTLNRLSLFRKPWSSGEKVSHLLYRYLCTLIPVHHPCSTARLVSCYALFKCMAASKPTS